MAPPPAGTTPARSSAAAARYGGERGREGDGSGGGGKGGSSTRGYPAEVERRSSAGLPSLSPQGGGFVRCPHPPPRYPRVVLHPQVGPDPRGLRGGDDAVLLRSIAAGSGMRPRGQQTGGGCTRSRCPAACPIRGSHPAEFCPCYVPIQAAVSFCGPKCCCRHRGSCLCFGGNLIPGAHRAAIHLGQGQCLGDAEGGGMALPSSLGYPVSPRHPMGLQDSTTPGPTGRRKRYGDSRVAWP